MPSTKRRTPVSSRRTVGYMSGAQRRKLNKKRWADYQSDVLKTTARRLAKLEKQTAAMTQQTSYIVMDNNFIIDPPHPDVRILPWNLSSFSDWDPIFGSDAQVSSFQPRATIKNYKIDLQFSIQDPTKALPKLTIQTFIVKLHPETAVQLLHETQELGGLAGRTNGLYYQSFQNDKNMQGLITLNPKYFKVIDEKRTVLMNTNLKDVAVGATGDDQPQFTQSSLQYKTDTLSLSCNDHIYNPTGSSGGQGTQNWSMLDNEKVEPRDRVYMLMYASGYRSHVDLPGTQEPNSVSCQAKVVAVAETIAS